MWVTARQACAAAPPVVGPLGDIGRIDVVGCQKLTVDEVRAGLRDCAEVQLASTPSAKLEDFLNALQRQTLEGLLREVVDAR